MEKLDKILLWLLKAEKRNEQLPRHFHYIMFAINSHTPKSQFWVEPCGQRYPYTLENPCFNLIKHLKCYFLRPLLSRSLGHHNPGSELPRIRGIRWRIFWVQGLAPEQVVMDRAGVQRMAVSEDGDELQKISYH